MEAVYVQGVWMAESLQQRTRSHETLWLVITHMGDPKASFLLVFPFTYFISRRTGVAALWVAAISEWLNLVFKWYGSNKSITVRNTLYTKNRLLATMVNANVYFQQILQ